MRRLVRVTEDFWASLDRALPGSDPSWHAFAARDLPEAMELFANNWDSLPRPIPRRDDYRQLLAPGTVVYAYVIDGQLAPDGAVELTRIAVDVLGPGDMPESDDEETA